MPSRAHRLPSTLFRAAVCSALLLSGGLPTAQATPSCASADQARQIREFYGAKRPGVPLPVPARLFAVPEIIIASSLPAANAIGAVGSPDNFRKVWKSIDSWGPKTTVKVVLAPGITHTFAFPSLVPISQPEKDDGFGIYDVYADEGRGVHAHIKLADVEAIYASDMPGKTPPGRTRAISFYGADGQLIVAVYAQMAPDPVDAAAVEGFARTWEVVKSLPRLCAADPLAGAAHGASHGAAPGTAAPPSAAAPPSTAVKPWAPPRKSP